MNINLNDYKKLQSEITNMVVYDFETFNTNRAITFANCIYRLSKCSSKNYQDIPNRETEQCKKDCIVFNGTDSINEMLDHVLEFKGEAKRVNIRIVKYTLYFIAHNGSGFDRYAVMNNLPQCRAVVSLIKNGSGIVSLKIFNGYVDENKKIPQHVHFRFGRVHIKNSLRKVGISDKIQPSLLKQETNHDNK